MKQQYFFAILLFAYIFIIFAVVIVFKIGYRLAEKEMRSAAMPSQQLLSAGKNSNKQKKFKVWVKIYLTKFCHYWFPIAKKFPIAEKCEISGFSIINTKQKAR